MNAKSILDVIKDAMGYNLDVPEPERKQVEESIERFNPRQDQIELNKKLKEVEKKLGEIARKLSTTRPVGMKDEDFRKQVIKRAEREAQQKIDAISPIKIGVLAEPEEGCEPSPAMRWYLMKSEGLQYTTNKVPHVIEIVAQLLGDLFRNRLRPEEAIEVWLWIRDAADYLADQLEDRSHQEACPGDERVSEKPPIKVVSASRAKVVVSGVALEFASEGPTGIMWGWGGHSGTEGVGSDGAGKTAPEPVEVNAPPAAQIVMVDSPRDFPEPVEVTKTGSLIVSVERVVDDAMQALADSTLGKIDPSEYDIEWVAKPFRPEEGEVFHHQRAHPTVTKLDKLALGVEHSIGNKKKAQARIRRFVSKLAHVIANAPAGTLSHDDIACFWTYIRPHCENLIEVLEQDPARKGEVNQLKSWRKQIFNALSK